jgi:hypothetical protein
MAEIGYELASEDWSPNDLVRLAVRADRGGLQHVFVHQIGSHHEAFFRFYESEILARV